MIENMKPNNIGKQKEKGLLEVSKKCSKNQKLQGHPSSNTQVYNAMRRHHNQFIRKQHSVSDISKSAISINAISFCSSYLSL